MDERWFHIGPLQLIRRSVRIAPEEGVLCWVDDGPGIESRGKYHPAAYRGGKFVTPDGKPLGLDPTFWTTQAPDRGPSPAFPPEKEAMHPRLIEAAEQARGRHRKRPTAPSVSISQDDGGWWYESPFLPEHDDDWLSLLAEAFGTRSQGVITTFVFCLADLCGSEWNPDAGVQGPDEDKLQTAIAMVTSQKPRNEAEAALCAQMVALHFATMAAGKHIAGGHSFDGRTIATMAAASKVYGSHLETLDKLHRPNRGKRQVYRSDRHVHMHYERGDPTGGGSDNFGGQPYGRTGKRARESSTESLATGDAMRGEEPGGEIMLSPGDAGEEALLLPRREVDRCAQGEGESSISPRRLEQRFDSTEAASFGPAEEDPAGEEK